MDDQGTTGTGERMPPSLPAAAWCRPITYVSPDQAVTDEGGREPRGILPPVTADYVRSDLTGTRHTAGYWTRTMTVQGGMIPPGNCARNAAFTKSGAAGV
jgi:hypothetical protein